MRVLVIGGNGFIGTHLSLRLIALGHRVRVMDLSPRRSELEHAGLEYLQIAWDDRQGVAAALRGVDVVFHLVSRTVPATADGAPILDIEYNLAGSVRLFQQLVEHGKKRVIFLSSGGTVYGNPPVLPVSEEQACRPLSSYGIVKVAIESYLEMYRLRGALAPVIVRAANPYGPLQSASSGQGVIATFSHLALDGQPLTVWGDGHQIRDYLYIDDLVDFLVAAFDSAIVGTFNVGSGCGYSVLQIIDALSEVLGFRPPVLSEKARCYDVKALVLDISRAEKELAWRPTIQIATGLQRTIDWMRSGKLDVET